VISADAIGPLPKTTSGNRYIFCFTCQLTAWPEFVAVPDITAATLVNAFYELIFWRYGAPLQIITDNGPAYISKQFTETMRELRIEHHRITPYSPTSNGLQERSHSTLNQILTKLVADNAADWDLVLTQALAGLRFNPCESRDQSPYFLLFGRDTVLPIDTLLGARLRYVGDEFHKTMLQRNHVIYSGVYKAISKHRKRRNKYADKGSKVITFEVNDPVYYKNYHRHNKLTPRWVPYYRVIEVIEPKNLVIKNLLDNSIVRCRVDQVRKADIAEWTLPEEQGVNPRPVRNCRYVIPPTADSSESDSSRSAGQINRNKVRLSKRQRDARRSSQTETDSEMHIPLARLQEKLRRNHFERTHIKSSSSNQGSFSETETIENSKCFSEENDSQTVSSDQNNKMYELTTASSADMSVQ
jgi:transposase InsO family protein